MRILFMLAAVLFAACPGRTDVLSAKVLGPGGKPIAGAIVVVIPEGSHWKHTETKSDVQGRFSYSSGSVLVQYTRVVIFSRGYAVAGGMLKDGSVFRLQPAGQAWGSVTDEKGNPIAGAVVSLGYVGSGARKDIVWIPHALTKYFRAKTTADGRWTISDVPTSGVASVFLDDPRYIRADTESQLGPDAVAAPPIIARSGASFEGEAVLEDGKPAVGIEVFAQGVGATPGWSQATTDNSGSYRLTGLPKGVFNVMVEDPSGKRIAPAIEAVEASETKTTKLPVLRLMVGSLVVGRVRDAETGKPISGVSVASYGPHRPRTSAAVVYTATDSSGSYRMRVAPGKNYIYLSSSPPGYPPPDDGVDILVPGSGTKTVSFRLSKGASVAGVVVGTDGKPVAGVNVVVTPKPSGTSIRLDSSREGKSDERGWFTVKGLTPGKAEVSVGGDYQVVMPKEIDAPTRSEIRIVVANAAEKAVSSVTGRVITPEGKPIGGAVVKAQVSSPLPGDMFSVDERNVTTNAHGEFKIASIPPKGTVRSISASKSGFSFVSGGRTSAKDGIVTVSDVVLAPLTGTLTGRVVDSVGHPTAGALVLPLGSAQDPVRTDSSGRFVLDHLPAAENTIAAAAGDAYGTATGKSGADVMITLKPSHRESSGDVARAYAVLEGILKQSKGTSYYGRPAVATEMAVADPDLALKLADASDAGSTDYTLAGAISVLIQKRSSQALEWGLPRLGDIKNTEMAISAMAGLGLLASRSEPAKAADLLEQASKLLQTSGYTGDAIRDNAWLAALAGRLGDARADAYLETALQALKKNDERGMGALVAQIAAEGSARLADKAISALPESERAEARFRAVTELAGYDLAAARDELAKIPDSDTEVYSAYARAAKYVIEAIGPDNPAEALSIAKSIKHRESWALALAAKYQDKQTASALLRDAAKLAGRESGSVNLLPRIAAIAYTIDRQTGIDIFNQAKSILGEQKGLTPDFTFYYSRVDESEARLLLESYNIDLSKSPTSDAWRRLSASLAMCSMDIERALEMARSISDVSAGFDAQRKIAQYMLAPESARKNLYFDRWDCSDTWIPGTSAGW